ncbi:hypothetical protein [Deinococcus sp. QL22]|uniref:hypothetical protein n=1 Tax=Deinococcus sp. QL22 TaxID=2939437 RepID=UPI0020173B2D|nr:hypothetical protein [Deinococcus sp. QL22]UQN09928.1 hypothetical protein M1R55_27560 [Deinococcus sp. QL22]
MGRAVKGGNWVVVSGQWTKRKGRSLGRFLALDAALACAACTTFAAAQAAYRMDSYVTLNGKTQRAFAWCDAPDRVLALTKPAKAPSTPQPVTLVRLLKNKPTKIQTEPYLLGPGDAGAGNLYVSLQPLRKTNIRQNDWFVHSSNVENVNDPAYRMTHIGWINTPIDTAQCRYVPDAAFMGVTAKRTIIIWENGSKITYATRNFDGTPGVSLSGGTRAQNDIGPEYTFNTAGYTYLLKFHPHAAFVQVKQGAQVLQTEPFLAYSISTPLSNPAQQEQP